MATATEITNLWFGERGPQVKPTTITSTRIHDRDPNRRRATFHVRYPLLEITLEKSDDRRTKFPHKSESTNRRFVPGIRLRLAPSLTLSNVDFSECTFHSRDAQGEFKILGSTFQECRFDRCILGGMLFDRVTFKNSSFSRCDFGTSRFTECQFVNCIFTECTAENASFLATEIDATAFLKGMPPPKYNYGERIEPWEASEAEVVADWVEVRRKVAAQLLRSNSEIHNSVNSDRALYELKRAELVVSGKALRAQSLKEVPGMLLRALRVGLEWLVLVATKGGTSLGRLFLAAMFFVPVYTLFLAISHVTFMSQDCHLNSLELSLWLQELARAISLFLAFGYTAFSGGALATVILTGASAIGLLWYALVAEVIIHRVYR
jgi:hypothetical protein